MEKIEFKIEAGKMYDTRPLPLQVMAIAEGYVMARFEGCAPFAEKIERFRFRVKMSLENKKPA